MPEDSKNLFLYFFIKNLPLNIARKSKRNGMNASDQQIGSLSLNNSSFHDMITGRVSKANTQFTYPVSNESCEINPTPGLKLRSQ